MFDPIKTQIRPGPLKNVFHKYYSNLKRRDQVLFSHTDNIYCILFLSKMKGEVVDKSNNRIRIF